MIVICGCLLKTWIICENHAALSFLMMIASSCTRSTRSTKSQVSLLNTLYVLVATLFPFLGINLTTALLPKVAMSAVEALALRQEAVSVELQRKPWERCLMGRSPTSKGMVPASSPNNQRKKTRIRNKKLPRSCRKTSKRFSSIISIIFWEVH